jgi:hypothetical protein
MCDLGWRLSRPEAEDDRRNYVEAQGKDDHGGETELHGKQGP